MIMCGIHIDTMMACTLQPQKKSLHCQRTPYLATIIWIKGIFIMYVVQWSARSLFHWEIYCKTHCILQQLAKRDVGLAAKMVPMPSLLRPSCATVHAAIKPVVVQPYL